VAVFIIMAPGAATMHEITFTDGLADQANFYAYPMPRINDIPPIEVHVMENAADAGVLVSLAWFEPVDGVNSSNYFFV